MSKTDEKNREKQEKLRELSEQDRQLAVMRVSRVVKALDKSYVLSCSFINTLLLFTTSTNR